MSAVNRNLIMHTLILRSPQKKKDYAGPRLCDAVRKCNMRMQCVHVQPVICRQNIDFLP